MVGMPVDYAVIQRLFEDAAKNNTDNLKNVLISLRHVLGVLADSRKEKGKVMGDKTAFKHYQKLVSILNKYEEQSLSSQAKHGSKTYFSYSTKSLIDRVIDNLTGKYDNLEIFKMHKHKDGIVGYLAEFQKQDLGSFRKAWDLYDENTKNKLIKEAAAQRREAWVNDKYGD